MAIKDYFDVLLHMKRNKITLEDIGRAVGIDDRATVYNILKGNRPNSGYLEPMYDFIFNRKPKKEKKNAIANTKRLQAHGSRVRHAKGNKKGKRT